MRRKLSSYLIESHDEIGISTLSEERREASYELLDD
jgi:hypothetical protein